jgi:hypothetical protein
MPIVVENIPPLQNFSLPEDPNQEFEYKFLRKVLGGRNISEGFYAIPTDRVNDIEGGLLSYKALTSTFNPLLPRSPGQHGAQVSCISQHRTSRARENLQPFALFIRSAESGYQYLGHYREPSPSDFLGRDEIIRMPKHVKEYWAHRLGAIPRHDRYKEERYLHSLQDFWKEYHQPVGFFDPSSDTFVEYDVNLEEDGDRALVERSITLDEANEIDASDILGAFETV